MKIPLNLTTTMHVQASNAKGKAKYGPLDPKEISSMLDGMRMKLSDFLHERETLHQRIR